MQFLVLLVLFMIKWNPTQINSWSRTSRVGEPLLISFVRALISKGYCYSTPTNNNPASSTVQMVLLTNSPHQRDEQSSKRVPVGKRPGRLNGVVPLVTPLPCCLNTGGNLNLGRKKFNWVSCRRNSGALLAGLIEFVEEEKTSFGGSVSGFSLRARVV